MNKAIKLTLHGSKKFILYIVAILPAIIPGRANCQRISNKKLQQTVIQAYKKAYPACVQIYAYDTVAKQQAGGQFSGVVVSKDGYIFTAAHVETPGVIYKVTFPDGRSCLAGGLGKIVLKDDKTIPDVALIKIITAGIWPYAQLGSSRALKIYEPCLSISYPESLGQPEPVLRFGYISKIKNDRGFIQSTCLMEPGDSGGPLFDYLGRLIGLHSAIEIPEESNYDVPVDLYKKYFTALKIAKVYDAYPDREDIISADPPAATIISLPGLVKGRSFTAGASKFGNSCLGVVSSINGKTVNVNGTLFYFGNEPAQNQHKSLIVSKSSLVSDQPWIIWADHHRVNAKVIARDKENDLVLLEPAEDVKGGISYDQLTKAGRLIFQPGVLLVSLQRDSSGSASILGSSVFPIKKMANQGFLGVGFKSRNAPLKVTYVFPNLNKSIYQVSAGDEILKINDSIPQSFEDLSKLLGRFWPGDPVTLQLKRGDTSFTRTIMLDTVPQRHFNHPAEMFAGGKSDRRDGFNAVFTHDAIVQPDRCGGPVFDLSGNFYGINIARFSRVSCLAIPGSVICRFIRTSLSLSTQIKTYHPSNNSFGYADVPRGFYKLKNNIR